MKKLVNICLVAILIVVTSCKDDFVEVEDPTSITGPNQFKSPTDLIEGEIVSLYANLHEEDLFGWRGVTDVLYPLDHTVDYQWTDFHDWNAYGTHDRIRAGSNSAKQLWRAFYRGVQISNDLFLNLEKYGSEVNADYAKHVKGEAHFLRALHYFYLINFFGEGKATESNKMGVPLLTKVATTRDEMYVERASIAEVYELIIEDLGNAAELLEGHNWSDNFISRATEWSAKALLGKVYVYRGDYNAAKTVLKDVIDNSGKGLVSWDVYTKMFSSEQYEMNMESLFEVSLARDGKNWGPWSGNAGAWTYAIIAPSVVTVSDDGKKEQIGGTGWSNLFFHDKNIQRFGFDIMPPKNVYLKTSATDSILIYNLKDLSYIAAVINARANKTVDPRLFVTAFVPYSDSTMHEGVKKAIAPYFGVEHDKYQAWNLKKFNYVPETNVWEHGESGINFPILRMADIYLLYAEVLKETGEASMALEYVNKVHRRAYGQPINGTWSGDYTSLTDNTVANDNVLGTDPLKYERWAELFGEGQWWFDIRRWDLGVAETNYYKTTRAGNIIFNPSQDYALPIPQLEMDSNPKMKQNPGTW